MDKTINIVNTTKNMLDRVFPSQFDLTKEGSNGFKLINLLYGIDFEEIKKQLKIIGGSIDYSNYDYEMDGDYQEVTVSKLSEKTITGLAIDTGDVVDIKITTGSEYDSGIPTRLSYLKTYSFDDIAEEYKSKKIIGLEYFRATETTGKLLITFDETLNGTNNQSIFIDITNTGTILFDTLVPMKLGVNNQSYESTGKYEIINVPSNSQLQSDYPTTRTITAINPDTGDIESFEITHYTPDLGYVWSEVEHTYVAIVPTDIFYINDVGQKVWTETSLNNPYYGNPPIVKLEHVPLPGTLKLYDIDNLTPDGELYEIANNQPIYFHSGEFTHDGYTEYALPYKGYSDTVPEAFVPDTVPLNQRPIAATQLTTFSYELLPNDTYVDELNNQIVIGTSDVLGPYIRISNPIGRLVITYDYTDIDHYTYITSLNASRYVKFHNGDYLLSVKNKENTLTEIPVSNSIEPTSDNNRIAATFDGLDVRPGSTINQLDIYTQLSINTEQSTPHFSSSVNGSVVGSDLSRKIIPIENTPTKILSLDSLSLPTRVIDNNRQYLKFINISDAECDHFNRYVYRTGEFYLRCNYVPFYFNTSDRVLDITIRLYHNVTYPIILGSGCNFDKSDYWILLIDEDGYIHFYDTSIHLQSTDTIDIHNKLNIQIVSNYNSLADIQEPEYIMFATKNGYLQQLDCIETVSDNTSVLNSLPIDITNTCSFVINNSVDVYDISIYDTE